MPTKRFKIFQKIAQTQTTTTDVTDPTVDTNSPATTPSTIPGSPREVTVDTYFPTFTQAWGSQFKEPTNELLSTLNWTIFVLSVGQMDLDNLRQNHFNVDASKYPDAFLNGAIGLGKQIYHLLLNDGQPFTTQIADKSSVIDKLNQAVSTNSKIPDSLSGTFPQSFLQTKIGNFKPKVISVLTRMKSLSSQK